jgi:hypothetical protein
MKALNFIQKLLKLNWRFKFNFQFEFEFRKHRTIMRDMIGWLRLATSAHLEIFSSFLKVNIPRKTLENLRKALTLSSLSVRVNRPGWPGEPAWVTGRPGTTLEGAGWPGHLGRLTQPGCRKPITASSGELGINTPSSSFLGFRLPFHWNLPSLLPSLPTPFQALLAKITSRVWVWEAFEV